MHMELAHLLLHLTRAGVHHQVAAQIIGGIAAVTRSQPTASTGRPTTPGNVTPRKADREQTTPTR